MTDVAAAVVATVVSPFDEESKKEEEISEDSNAVQCPTYWTTSYLAFILQSTRVVGFFRVVALCSGIGQVYTGSAFDDQPLEFLANLFLGLATNSIGLALPALRRCVIDDQEHLQRSELVDDEELGLATEALGVAQDVATKNAAATECEHAAT